MKWRDVLCPFSKSNIKEEKKKKELLQIEIDVFTLININVETKLIRTNIEILIWTFACM